MYAVPPGLTAQLGHEIRGHGERAVDRGHKHPTLDVEHAEGHTLFIDECLTPDPGVAFGVVGRPQQPVFVVEVRLRLHAIPDVIARRHDVGTPAKERVSHFSRATETGGRVFHVDDSHVRAELLFESRQHVIGRPPTRFAYHISDEEDMDAAHQRAYSTDRVSRITVTLI